ncbi:glycosyltransferase, partial [Actinoplanes sp. RD1]|uniref:glycosyltransferase n=1 Tax=Actinoplanes sp. RD1 TaxID=3064538 RepID=UPI00274120FE
MVLRAFAVVRERLDARLVLAGTGTEQRSPARLAARLGVAEHVSFPGFVPDADLPAVYAEATVFVNAGTAELQSLVTLEAMASGRPVVGADAAALPHLVTALFPPGDSAALA